MAKKQLQKRTESGTYKKSVIWHPAAREIVSSFPEDARSEVGYLLFRLQKGEMIEMPLARSMPSVAPGVFELRVRGRDGSFRVFYLLKHESGILAFHAFQKKTEKAEQADIKLGQKRLKELIRGIDGKD